MSVNISKDSSIYQYTLIKRIYHRVILSILFYALTIITVIILLALEGGNIAAIGWFFLAYLIVHAGHTVWFSRFTRSKNKYSTTATWGYVWYFPWQGIIPKSYAPLSFLWKTHLHLFVIGICVCLLTIPWMPTALSCGIVFFHLIILVPRIIMFEILRRKNPNGIARITKPHISLYKS